jgi:hypothetical protein
VHEINYPLHCSAEVKDKWNCTSTTPVCLPEDGDSMFLRDTGTQLPEYAAPQRRIYLFKSLNYILVEIVKVKMGLVCSSEILRAISIQKATKLNGGYSFQYRDTY